MHDILAEFRIHYYSAIHVVLRPLTPGFLQCAAQLTLLTGTLFPILRTLMYRHFNPLWYHSFSFFVLCSNLHLSPYKSMPKFFNSVVLVHQFSYTLYYHSSVTTSFPHFFLSISVLFFWNSEVNEWHSLVLAQWTGSSSRAQPSILSISESPFEAKLTHFSHPVTTSKSK